MKKYQTVAKDANNFYRGTAHIFWQDFAIPGGTAWGSMDLGELGISTTLADGSPFTRTSAWTWITGDQHLSNFGAWKNRHGDVVFGVNDFDEAAVFDFRIDVWRCAVSIYNHAISNHLGAPQAEAAVLTFTETYLSTVRSYVGNERALLYEKTPQTANGKLKSFLAQVENGQSHAKELKRFTTVDSTGSRRFLKDATTSLGAVSPQIDAEIRRAFSADAYGATIKRVGWHVKTWDDDYFQVLDVAERLGAGVGSFGVHRYYVLLKGGSGNNRTGFSGIDVDNDDGFDGEPGVILDVKFEPEAAASYALQRADRAWYRKLFRNEAMRAVEGQTRLTSYTDPFCGVATIFGQHYVVRQRSAYKASIDLDTMRSYSEFAEYVQEIAVITATSHTRGTYGKSPGEFKEVIAAVFGQTYARTTWGISVAKVAASYREQVLLDYNCFAEFVSSNMTKWASEAFLNATRTA